MQKIFHNILVPVHLDKRVNKTIGTAVDFSNRLGCHLHLFFPVKPSFLKWYNQKEKDALKKGKILALKQKYQPLLKEGLKLFVACQYDAGYYDFAKYAAGHEIDMLLSLQQDKGNGFRSKYLSEVNCPVITLKIHPPIQPLKAIVLPVATSFPINKIRIAAYLAKHFNLAIHLLSLKNDQPQKERGYMERAFELLKSNTDLSIVCDSVAGKRLDDLALAYASAHAGMLIMNAERETNMPWLITKIFLKFTHRELEVPVITVG